MTRLHTHYDNLKVSRDAPQEVIRASYKALAQKYHPDRNNGDPEANRITAAINMSYAELSNPKLRREHDAWIKAQELRSAAAATPPEQQASAVHHQHSSPPSPTQTGEATASNRTQPNAAPKAKRTGPMARAARHWYLFAVIGFAGWIWSQDSGSDTQKSTRHNGPTKVAYSRATSAPNGQPWPSTPSYVAGYERLNRGGLSSVLVDNSRLDSDVFVKLVSLDSSVPVPVRQFFIPAGSSFKAGKLTSGRYDVRYRLLDSGALSRSESFTLEQTDGPEGTRFSNMTMTLYKVRDGNMKTFGLSESDF